MFSLVLHYVTLKCYFLCYGDLCSLIKIDNLLYAGDVVLVKVIMKDLIKILIVEIGKIKSTAWKV